MNHRKHGITLLGLMALAALAVMAFAASAGAHTYLVNKKFLLAEVGAVQEEKFGTMLVPGLNFELNCTAFTVDEGHIATSDDAKAVLLYTGCSTLSISKLPEEIGCHVKEPIKAEALLLPTLTTGGAFAILAEKIKALVELSDNVITAQWPLGSLPCVLPEDNTVTGEVCLKIAAGTNDTVEPLVETNSTIQGECKEKIALESLTEGAGFKDKLKYGAQEVTLDGKAKLFLKGPEKDGLLGVS